MPRTVGPDERGKAWIGAGDGLNKAVDLVVATAVWAGIGYLIDRWLDTWPIVFAIGAGIGNFTGIYVLYKRSIEESGDAARNSAAGVSRSWPRKPAIGRGEARTDEDNHER